MSKKKKNHKNKRNQQPHWAAKPTLIVMLKTIAEIILSYFI